MTLLGMFMMTSGFSLSNYNYYNTLVCLARVYIKHNNCDHK